MAAKSASEREREYRQRMREKGFKLVRVWVPPEKAEEVKALAESWRNKKGANP